MNQEKTNEPLSKTAVMPSTAKEEIEVDCIHFEYQIGIEDNDEICHIGLNLDNCETCINNKKLK